MDFLVHMEVTGVIEGGSQRQAELYLQESERARELGAMGTLRRLWRIPGRRANWGIWCTGTADELHAALASLPLYPYLTITVQPLASHPNDPRNALD